MNSDKMNAVRNKNFRKGFTLLELVITIIAATIFILGTTSILASWIKNYKTMYERTTSEVIRNAYETRRIFDRIVRQATIRRVDLGAGGNEIYVYYYSEPNNLAIVNPDRYAYFYLQGTELWLEQGIVTGNFTITPPALPSMTETSTIKLTNTDDDNDDVIINPPATGIFSIDGHSIRMVLVLDNKIDPQNKNKLAALKMTLTSTAIRHNQ